MESTALYFLTGCFMVLFLLVGIIFGWHINDIIYSLTNKGNMNLHPEMYDDEGLIINEELLSVRFIDEEEEEEDDYY